MEKNILAIGVIFFIILSVITPTVFGNNNIIHEKEVIVEEDNFNIYSKSERTSTEIKYLNFDNFECKEVIKLKEPVHLLDDPMDSPWPMYCHDIRHTGRSPFSTANNLGTEKWRFETDGWATGSPIIDEHGIIFIGARDLYAVYPNGSLKWKYDYPHHVESAPAIDESGVLYIGTVQAWPNYLYAIYSNNGSLKWKYSTGSGDIFSSPVIDENGIIIFCERDNWYIKALYPNGSLKWKYKTDHVIYSSPAIGNDGTIYCGSHDTYLYALYPNNGTLKWKYKTGDWIRTSPCIADDGTIYVVSLDNFLHAVNSDGSFKWKTNVGAGTSPTIGQDGTVYAGYTTLYALNPNNGSIKWQFDVDGTIRGGTPCNSIDGTIYIGTSEGGELIAIDSDGNERWRKSIGECESAPAIGEDGTVYIGSHASYLYAFGELDPNIPSTPSIDGETSGTIGVPYTYTLTSTSPIGNSLYYYVDWGDGSIDDWFGPYHSGEEAQAIHTWSNPRTYTIKARANDTDGLLSQWGELQIIIPKFKKTIPQTFPNIKESNPILYPLLQKFLQYFY